MRVKAVPLLAVLSALCLPNEVVAMQTEWTLTLSGGFHTQDAWLENAEWAMIRGGLNGDPCRSSGHFLCYYSGFPRTSSDFPLIGSAGATYSLNDAWEVGVSFVSRTNEIHGYFGGVPEIGISGAALNLKARSSALSAIAVRRLASAVRIGAGPTVHLVRMSSITGHRGGRVRSGDGITSKTTNTRLGLVFDLRVDLPARFVVGTRYDWTPSGTYGPYEASNFQGVTVTTLSFQSSLNSLSAYLGFRLLGSDN